MESHFLFVIENVDKEVYDFSKLQQFCDLMGFSFCKGEPICKDKYLEASPDERIFCQPDEYIYDHVAQFMSNLKRLMTNITLHLFWGH